MTESSTLHVAVLQSSLHWQHAAANRAQFSQQIAELVQSATTPLDLLVLPEMFNSGFSMQPERFAEDANGDTVHWLQAHAKQYQLALAGSIAIRTAQGFVNRLLFVTPDGTVQHYDKRHLFRMGDEHQHYQAGSERVIVQYRGWRVLLQICYDLRFPVFARNRNDYDLALYVANWPAPRARIWSTLLSARAIENQAYVIGCNRVGADPNGLQYSGDSVVLDVVGAPLASLPAHRVGALCATLDKQALDEFRRSFPAHLDSDEFVLQSQARD